ncbi:hydantoinase B/oxoprolinase family protein, partial [Klebsiella pneumoniae]|uniref:hydantoinase B/oxoprolinase family protein n=1 Tax=Klebsiella pneumoniae TaxID=573 RepID=UPI003B5B57E6
SLLTEFQLADLESLGGYVIEQSAQAMRQAIAEWPRGTWHNTLVIDGYDAPITLQASVTVGDGKILVDFDGTSPSVARGINVVKA